MLEINGIPPRLTQRLCEELICQQYWYHGKLAQEVDVLFIKVNWRWYQLYFDAGIVFWRTQQEAPTPVMQMAGSPFAYPLIDIGEKYEVKDSFISDCITEPLAEGARVTLVFEEKGSLIITHNENKTRLQFNKV